MRTDLARSALFARFLRAAVKSIHENGGPLSSLGYLDRYRSYIDAVASVEQVASELEALATEPGAEPDDAQMLEWVMENTDAGYRNEAKSAETHGVRWVDKYAIGRWTYGETYVDAIRLAMTECAAIEAADTEGAT